MKNKLAFIDTNIFIRFLVEDDPVKLKKCTALFKKIENEEIEVTTTPQHIFEIIYVLEGKIYNIPRLEIAENIKYIVSLQNIKIQDKKTLLESLIIYRDTKQRLDISDAYAIALMRASNIERIYSYDTDFDKYSNIKRVEP
jgi:predicted nucleic acid-binding protein